MPSAWIKIDIAGAEFDAISEAAVPLARTRGMIFEQIDGTDALEGARGTVSRVHHSNHFAQRSAH